LLRRIVIPLSSNLRSGVISGKWKSCVEACSVYTHLFPSTFCLFSGFHVQLFEQKVGCSSRLVHVTGFFTQSCMGCPREPHACFIGTPPGKVHYSLPHGKATRETPWVVPEVPHEERTDGQLMLTPP